MMPIVLIWLTILIFKVVMALYVLRTNPPSLEGGNFRQVAVLQPILSGDPTLESVLEANLYGLEGASFLWLIDENDEQAQSVTGRLKQRYPHMDIAIYRFPQPPEGVNPKLFKLEQGRKLTDKATLLVLDDDAILPAASLRTMTGALRENTLVTALPWYQPQLNLASRLLAQFVNDNAALTYLPLLPFAQPLSINGMCYLLDAALLERVGGFTPILRYLTDDLALATLLTRQGARLKQSTAPVCVQTSLPDSRRYLRQMHRWFLFATLLMREKTPAINTVITLLQGVPTLLMWTILWLGISGGTAQLTMLIAVLLIHYLALRRVQHATSPHIPGRPLLSLISALLQPLHLAHALVNRTIYWRSRRYRIHSNDRFTSI
jgi:ceramide glucosyltransferase